MRKRTRLAAPEEVFGPEDYISSLTDDILVSILSRVKLKEAAVTSILSRRWRYVWTHLARFNFNGNKMLDKTAANRKLKSSERPKYINWVNRVVRQHKGEIVDSVRICFDLDKSSKCALDNWVKFAISKGVQRLELDLLENSETLRQPMRNYTFPYKQLCKKMSMKNVMRPNFGQMKCCLKALSLKCVTVSEEAFDCILSECPLLKYLSIHGSGDLVNVKVCRPSLMLKHLEIVFCLGIETIEISNVNLVSFSYLGPGIDLVINNVPMLDEISIGEGYSGLENNVFGQLSCCLYQLEVLTLEIYRPEENIKISAFPELPKLKKLILKVGAWNDDSLLEFTSLVKACPNLNRFVLQLIWMAPAKRRRRIRKAAKCAHKFLKLVEIVGYYGRTSEAELVFYFIENALSLQKITIDPRNQILGRFPGGPDQIKKEESARKRARKQIEPKKPPGVQLIIL
ncbi:Unknown protein [Striga hermonthica]|uniref:Uncharacterized protein n=1 Tax=Striga hermonthica TaxID=68872 RepID=A0A9N7NTQ0_STRHE|nr:Unknown protein [Striga hermonthica]